ncbi:flagellar type III secretion system pore protein FliP [Jannaschia seohaensis]|uniref:Flagellar biosynthetic protein FliP n=1 Tax=Jannaschia seohaensis TaxID=475081 RepID=A0A2Y9AZE0_9RHOB|nr:flagellar type III secretion system pore protein FliP [Jannaschia seohaensis]PWJ17406.1 flagellar biosynthetic protein FliP [Jannaschia seohaensis]SSA47469.1 flagellar biosynthetic protein FliP [Jannaschia seohaensis]
MRRPSWALLAVGLALIPTAALAQDTGGLEALFTDEGSLTLRTMQLIALLTVLSLAPGIAITVTCFPFIVTVLSILRQAIGLQASPPNMLIVSLAMFLTYFVMEPVFVAAWQEGLRPLSEGNLTPEAAFAATLAPFQGFMAARVDPETLEHLRALRPDAAGDNLSVLVPSFLLSEISRAFQIGFLVFMPFLIIDMVAAAVLMSMGMMMVPPAIVSLPFKLAFFVVVDGWTLVAGALVQSYG